MRDRVVILLTLASAAFARGDRLTGAALVKEASYLVDRLRNPLDFLTYTQRLEALVKQHLLPTPE